MDENPDSEPQPGDVEINVSGEVVADSTGDPIEGATVSASRVEGGEQLDEATTGADGGYEISLTVAENNTPDRLRLSGDADGFLASADTISFDSSVSKNFSLAEAVESQVSGQVTDSKVGDGISNATVIGTSEGEEGQLFETTTDSDGRYSNDLELAEEPEQITIEVAPENYEGAEETVQFAEEITLDLALAPEVVDVSVSGTVTSGDGGSAIEDAKVKGIRPDEEELVADTMTSNDGSYELLFSVDAPRAPGEVRIEVREAFGHEDQESVVDFDSSVTVDLTLATVPIEISSLEGLQKIGDERKYPLDRDYVLVSDIDATPTEGMNNGKGFEPIGTSSTESFRGTFNGNGFVISNLTIDRPGVSTLGLFQIISGAGEVLDLTLSEVSIKGSAAVGGIVGRLSQDSDIGGIKGCKVSGIVDVGDGRSVGGIAGIISGISTVEAVKVENSSFQGLVVGNLNVGGLVGENDGSTIRGSRSDGEVEVETQGDLLKASASRVGGLVGSNGGTIKGSRSSITIVPDSIELVGGLVGLNGGLITKSYSTGDVSGSSAVGGLAGRNADNSDSRIVESWSSSAVSGDKETGGLVGANGGLVDKSYASGSVSGSQRVGGLVGINEDVSSASVSESYAVGNVSGNEDVAGLIGINDGESSSNFWDTESTGQDSGVGEGVFEGVTGLTTSEMQGGSAEQNMEGFDFQNTWNTVMNGYPALQWEE